MEDRDRVSRVKAARIKKARGSRTYKGCFGNVVIRRDTNWKPRLSLPKQSIWSPSL